MLDHDFTGTLESANQNKNQILAANKESPQLGTHRSTEIANEEYNLFGTCASDLFHWFGCVIYQPPSFARQTNFRIGFCPSSQKAPFTVNSPNTICLRGGCWIRGEACGEISLHTTFHTLHSQFILFTLNIRSFT